MSNQSVFAIYGAAGFAPFYVPSRFSGSKERNLDREENFCGLEDVSDLGAKNREFHISGLIQQPELESFNGLLDSSEVHQLVYPGWTGEIRIMDGEYEGPTSIDPMTGDYLYKYNMNVVSTGRSEL